MPSGNRDSSLSGVPTRYLHEVGVYQFHGQVITSEQPTHWTTLFELSQGLVAGSGVQGYLREISPTALQVCQQLGLADHEIDNDAILECLANWKPF